MPNDWLETALLQLDAVAKLETGWDACGAPPVDRSVIERAAGLLDALSKCDGIPRPHIDPTRDGGVQFNWEEGSLYLEIEIEVGEPELGYYFENKVYEKDGTVSAEDLPKTVWHYLRMSR